MHLAVNGEQRELPEGSTVSRLLETLRISPERVVVEVNLTILKRAAHPQTMLKDGDRVEIVHFVGGGSGCRLHAAGCKLQEVVPTSCSLKRAAWNSGYSI